ncbi:MAG: MlaD family protein [Candidatus Dormibacteria bacterium]
MNGRKGAVALGAAMAVAIVAVLGASLGLSLGSGNNNYVLHAHFPGVNGIIVGSDVYLGGVKVGIVRDLQVDTDSHGATVTMDIGEQYGPFHQGATAAVRPKSLLGEKYIAMTAGDPSRDALPGGSTLPAQDTSVNVELDQLINTFDEPTRKSLQGLITELGKGLAGQGPNTNTTIQAGTQDFNSLAAVTDVLNQRDAELKTVIQSLTRLTETLASDQQRTNYPLLLKHSDTVLQALKDEDADVQKGIDRMNSFFGEIDQGLSGQGGNLQEIFTQLGPTLNNLDALSIQLNKQGQVIYPLTAGVVAGVLVGPQIFGAQPQTTTFTHNVYTRVQTPSGCMTVNATKPDGGDSGSPNSVTCGFPGGACANTSNPNPAACAAALQTVACAVTGNKLPGCPISAAGGITGGATSQGSGRSATIGSAPPIDPGLSNEVQQDLLRFLLQ